MVWNRSLAYPLLLEGTAAMVWQLLDGTPISELVKELASGLGVDPAIVERDVLLLIAELIELDLVHESGAPAEVATRTAAEVPVLQSPTVRPSPCLSQVLHAERATRLNLAVGPLRFGVLIEPVEVLRLLEASLSSVMTSESARWRYAVIVEQGAQPARLLVLNDVGLPLARTADPDSVAATVASHVSNLVDMQQLSYPWFRSYSAVRDGCAVLLQPEFLHPFSDVEAGLSSRGYRMISAAYTAVDPVSGEILEHPCRFDVGSTRQTVDRTVPRRHLGTIMHFGPDTSPEPATPAGQLWTLALLASIGHDPRADAPRAILDGARRMLQSGPIVGARSFAASHLFEALDALE